jgi:hypothetical protein
MMRGKRLGRTLGETAAFIPQTLWLKVRERRKDAASDRHDKHKARTPKYPLVVVLFDYSISGPWMIV